MHEKAAAFRRNARRISRTSTKASGEFDRIEGWGRKKKKKPLQGINL
jgi:hypothetical protein